MSQRVIFKFWNFLLISISLFFSKNFIVAHKYVPTCKQYLNLTQQIATCSNLTQTTRSSNPNPNLTNLAQPKLTIFTNARESP